MTEHRPAYQQFYSRAFLPNTETREEMAEQIDHWKVELAKSLSAYMVQNGGVDLAMKQGINDKGQAGYIATATTCIINPAIVVNEESFVYSRMRDIILSYDWDDDEDNSIKDKLMEFLDNMEPIPIPFN